MELPHERRKYHRIGTDQVISFAEIDRPDRLAVSRNLSSGGISFEAVGCEINLGDTLRVTFNVGEPPVDVITLRARGCLKLHGSVA